VAGSCDEQKKWLEALKIAMRRARDPAFAALVREDQI
jgi:hypothetical protein